MMDPTGLFPKGFHPIRTKLTPNANSKAKYIQRSSLKTLPRYYFIDFGISTWFRKPDPNDESTRWEYWPHRLSPNRGCQDQTVPELYDPGPHDPFPVDVYLIGNVIRTRFIFVSCGVQALYELVDHSLQKYSNLKFLIPLSKTMRTDEASERPTAKEALELFEKIVS